MDWSLWFYRYYIVAGVIRSSACLGKEIPVKFLIAPYLTTIQNNRLVAQCQESLNIPPTFRGYKQVSYIMRFLLILLLVGFSIGTPAAARTILVVGDSISAAYGLDEAQGWVQLAQKELVSTYSDIKFVNASISGDTTEGALRRLPAALERFEPDIVVIELGGNDGLRGYPIKRIQENLQALTSLSQEANAEVLILGMRIPSNYGPAYTEKFAQTFVDAAAAGEAELVPFFLEPIVTDVRYFQRDGIHPTAEAQPLMLGLVLEKLVPMLETIAEPQ